MSPGPRLSWQCGHCVQNFFTCSPRSCRDPQEKHTKTQPPRRLFVASTKNTITGQSIERDASDEEDAPRPPTNSYVALLCALAAGLRKGDGQSIERGAKHEQDAPRPLDRSHVALICE